MDRRDRIGPFPSLPHALGALIVLGIQVVVIAALLDSVPVGVGGGIVIGWAVGLLTGRAAIHRAISQLQSRDG